MTAMTLPELAKKLADIDFAMLLTHTEHGQIAGRPMSNNGDVEYDGHSYYFSLEDTRTVDDIKRDPTVALSFAGSKGLLGRPGLMVSVEATAEIVRDKAAFADHWVPDLERWFEQGVDTPELVMIKARASRIHYWNGEDEGEIVL